MCFFHLIKDLHSYIYERDNYNYIKALETTVPGQQLHRDRDTVPAILDTKTHRHKDTETHRHTDNTHRERETKTHTERNREKKETYTDNIIRYLDYCA